MTLILYRDQAATYRNVPPHQLEQQAGAEADLGQHSESTPKNSPSQPKGSPAAPKKMVYSNKLKKNIYLVLSVNTIRKHNYCRLA